MHPAGYERASSSSHPSRRAPIVAAHGGSEPNLDGETDTQKQARAPMKGVKEHASRAQPAAGGWGLPSTARTRASSAPSRPALLAFSNSAPCKKLSTGESRYAFASGLPSSKTRKPST